MELVAAKCPSCGADIQVPNNKDFAFCTFCGSNVKVRESVIMKSDVDTDNLVTLGNVELQAKDYNEAMDYFTRVLEADGKNHNAWLGKGKATIRKSKSELKLYEEAFVYFQNASDHCPETGREDLINGIIEEYNGKEFFTAHIEFLDKLVKLRPEKKFLLLLISRIDSVETDMQKSGNKLAPVKEAIRTDALTLLKEHFPQDYEKYLKDAEKWRNARDDQSANNEIIEFEKKKRALFSGKRFLGDLFTTSLLNIIITGIIIMLFDSFDISVREGAGRFFTIFFVLAVFTNFAVFMNKRRELKQMRDNLPFDKNKFKQMIQ
jgi:tetratricopeptide (TPR) repeat protein